jgi:hypothetical protein
MAGMLTTWTSGGATATGGGIAGAPEASPGSRQCGRTETIGGASS